MESEWYQVLEYTKRLGSRWPCAVFADNTYRTLEEAKQAMEKRFLRRKEEGYDISTTDPYKLWSGDTEIFFYAQRLEKREPPKPRYSSEWDVTTI